MVTRGHIVNKQTGYMGNFFNCIIALGLIEYLETDESLAKEIFRVLKPKGIAIISFRNELFKKYSGREFEPERRTHKPEVELSGFEKESIVYFHKHPKKFNNESYNHSAFVCKFRKLTTLTQKLKEE